MFVIERCSILTCDHLTELCKACFSDSKIASEMKLHCTKCSYLLKNVLMPHVLNDLQQDISNECFSHECLQGGTEGTFGTDSGNFWGAQIFEIVACNANNKLDLNFLFFLLTNALAI